MVLQDKPERGLNYKGLTIAREGPCKGLFETGDIGPDNKKACYHLDPGPPGIDVRERDKNIEEDLADLAAKDEKHPPKGSDDPEAEAEPTEDEAANVRWAGSLGEVYPRNWPCYGDGQDGYRVLFVYAYKSGTTNRLSSLRSGFAGIARRMNAVVYNSGAASGKGVQIRFRTNPDCALTIVAVPITGDINNYGNVVNQVRAKGYDSYRRKYIVQVDGGTNCGVAGMWSDDSPGDTNYNNRGDMFAVIWKPCWNYAEPHEFAHILGAVQLSAPHKTAGFHCYDQNDVMCYDDGTAGSTMRVICTSSTSIWRYDCRHDDYFDSYAPSSYLSTHWNIANNRFLR